MKKRFNEADEQMWILAFSNVVSVFKSFIYSNKHSLGLQKSWY